MLNRVFMNRRFDRSLREHINIIKNKFYKVLFTATSTDTLKPVVVYKALYKSEKFGPFWVRTLDEFNGYEDNGLQPVCKRFTFIPGTFKHNPFIKRK